MTRRYPARRWTKKTPYRQRRRSTVRPKIKARRFKRRVLNVSTRKKRDVMLPQAGSINTPGNLGGTRIVAQPMSTAGQYFSAHFIWCATARANEDGGFDGPSNINQEASRTATDCYIRGVKENISIQTHGAASWFWRRIVFTMFGDNQLRADDGNVHVPYNSSDDTGVTRLVGRFDADNTFSENIQSLVFRGVEGSDWIDPITAPLDTRRIKIVRDVKQNIRSGNDFGTTKNMKRWYPINKTLRYNEEQKGGHQTGSLLSSLDSTSMGDLYIYDIFQNARHASEQDWIDFSPEATLYWHER